MKIDLIQPRHNYASENKSKLGHLYMPTSLLTVGARLLNIGVDVDFYDENFKFYDNKTNYVGVNLLGAPYIPEVIKLQQRIKQNSKEDFKFILGGQVISGLSKDQFTRLFGQSAYNGNNDSILLNSLGINLRKLPSPESISLISTYKKLDDKLMKEYLSREFSIYVSQGCKFACDFCAAVRTYEDPITQEIIKIKESYRDIEVIKNDLDYLVTKAESFGLKNLQLYMSNLDVFQSPGQLLNFAYAVQDVKKSHPQFNINLRGLSTVASFIKTRDENRQSIEELIKAGFNTVGFGVDGMTPQVWRQVKKGHNTEDKCIEAIRSAREDFGLTPETLMVFGHEGVDTEETLKAAYEFTLDMVKKYRAIPRPHVSKAFIPGNKGWTDPKYSEQVEKLIKNPESFQSLDFTALPSILTHPEIGLRELATKYFLQICSIPECTTLYTTPITHTMGHTEIREKNKFNEGRFDH